MIHFVMQQGKEIYTAEHVTCELDSALCNPCVRPPCSYRWINRVNNETIALEREISLTQHRGSSYSFQCLISCEVAEDKYSVSADIITCLSKASQLFNLFLH